MTRTRWLSDTQQRAWRGYLAMQGRLNARLNRQLQHDSELSLSDFAVLVFLSETAGVRVRVFELARALDWEKSRLSHHIGRMERRGLVAREGCPEDARGAFVVLTETGRAAIEQAAPRHVEAVQRLLFDLLTEEEVDVLRTISERVLANLETDQTG